MKYQIVATIMTCIYLLQKGYNEPLYTNTMVHMCFHNMIIIGIIIYLNLFNIQIIKHES